MRVSRQLSAAARIRDIGGMPVMNRFQPQQYSLEKPSAPFKLITPIPPQVFDASAIQTQMRQLGERLVQARVQRIILVHGTMAGTDALGILDSVDRFLPEVARSLGELRKRMVDALVGDVGNYSRDFVERFSQSLTGVDAESSNIRQAQLRPSPIVERFLWTSENHHLGRAWAAVHLLAQLMSLDLQSDERVLLWGHSHAGNVFAIVSNLLGGAVEDRRLFFAALEPDVDEDGDKAVCTSVEQQLNDGPAVERLANAIDFVTFGTPIRYGWESNGFGRLLHFVNHQRTEGVPEWRAPFPQSVDEVRAALLGATGDYVQQTFIAGTDFPSSVLSRGARQASKNLGELLEPNTRRRDLLKRLRTGPRVAADGTTLLVDYRGPDEPLERVEEAGIRDGSTAVGGGNQAIDGEIGARQLAGHGVYTTLAWLPFHLNEVVERNYT